MLRRDDPKDLEFPLSVRIRRFFLDNAPYYVLLGPPTLIWKALTTFFFPVTVPAVLAGALVYEYSDLLPARSLLLAVIVGALVALACIQAWTAAHFKRRMSALESWRSEQEWALGEDMDEDAGD